MKAVKKMAAFDALFILALAMLLAGCGKDAGQLGA